jgi:hypothetical protein
LSANKHTDQSIGVSGAVRKEDEVKAQLHRARALRNWGTDTDLRTNSKHIVLESGLLGAFHFDGACTAGDG